MPTRHRSLHGRYDIDAAFDDPDRADEAHEFVRQRLAVMPQLSRSTAQSLPVSTIRRIERDVRMRAGGLAEEQRVLTVRCF